MTTQEQRPNCIGFIMDGNRRWARKNGKKGIEGHSEGYKKLKEILNWAKEAGIPHVIVYAFSTENWKRTEEEVGALMKLLTFALSSEVDALMRQGVRLKFAGELTLFPRSFQEMMKKAETETADNGPLTLTVALSYGGRAEILQAVKRIAQLPKAEQEALTEQSFENYLWTSGMPDPDLMVRTGGEVRLSNFLPYQIVYSELFFTKTLWPDFSKNEFEAILKEYSERKRNYGK
jgi:undecaprenyl diphosphate synthase